ncbi:hypothetical protein AVEN_214807-1, partial [Araneus ventricosus]
AGQEEMRSGQERLEQEIKTHVDGRIGKIEEEVQCVKLKIVEVESEVQRKIEGVEEQVQEKIGNLERRINELEERPNYFPASQEFVSSRPMSNP